MSIILFSIFNFFSSLFSDVGGETSVSMVWVCFFINFLFVLGILGGGELSEADEKLGEVEKPLQQVQALL